MKRFLSRCLGLALLAAPLWGGTSVTFDGPMTDANAALGQAYPNNFTMNLDDKNIDVAALTMVYSSTFPGVAAASFNDGTASSQTITVVTPTSLSSATATAKVIISSNTALTRQTLYIAGVNLPFNVGVVSSMTACDMAGKMNASTPFLSTCAVNNATGIIYSTAPTYGSTYNQYSIQSSSITAISSAAFSGGVDNAQLCINGTCLQANRNWYPTASVATTTDSLYRAINSSFTIVVATGVGATGVIYTTATTVGANNYAIVSSSNVPLKISGSVTQTGAGVGTGAYAGGTAASFTIGNPIVTIANHKLSSAMGVYVSSTAGTNKLFWSTSTVGGTKQEFKQGTTYYAIPLTLNTVEFAETSTGAVAGLPIIWSSSQAVTTTDTYTLNISTVVGPFSYGTWVGNDGSNFVQVGSTNSWTVYPVVSSATFYDFGTIDYKWLQLRVVGPTSGAVSVNTSLHGEKR